MKKFISLTIFVILAGITLNCNHPIPQNAFRVQTRGKFHLFGIPLPFSIPNPNIAINLKTNTTAGTAGTTGTITEFSQGGAFVTTDGGGNFDAVNAVIPAPYNAKIAPNQSRCSVPTSSVFPFNAVAGGKTKLDCKFNIQITFLVQPGYVDLSTPGSSGNSLTGTLAKTINNEVIFLNAQNLKILYYRQVSGEDYLLDGEKLPNWISADGTTVEMPLPDYTSNHGLQHYRLLIVEDGPQDIYLGHGELDVQYPTPAPTPTPCPPAPRNGDAELCEQS
jgi:hypothetical protein